MDDDGISEILIGNSNRRELWTMKDSEWRTVQGGMPAQIVERDGRDFGARFADLDDDGFVDLVVSNDTQSETYLYEQATGGFTKRVAGAGRIPPIARNGQNNGAWIADGHLWLQNEQTNRLPDGVGRLWLIAPESLDNLRRTQHQRRHCPLIGSPPAIVPSACQTNKSIESLWKLTCPSA